jgi:hypothetical protein
VGLGEESLAKIAKNAKKSSERIQIPDLGDLGGLGESHFRVARNSRRFASSPKSMTNARRATRIGPLALVCENIPVPARHIPDWY